jgi:hypothetical protein
MKRKVVVKASSLPPRSPATFGIVMWLLLDRLQAPQWAYGVLWTFVGLIYFGYIYDLWRIEQRDIPGFGEK